jgi:hypothetical protein
VSRKSVIEGFCDCCDKWRLDCDSRKCYKLNWIRELPNVIIQEQKTGKWITRHKNNYSECICSECGHTILGGDPDEMYYCENCGAKMVKEDEEK